MFVAMFGGLLGARIYILYCTEESDDQNAGFGTADRQQILCSDRASNYCFSHYGHHLRGHGGNPYGTLTNMMIYTWVQAPLTLLGANILACMIIVALSNFFGSLAFTECWLFIRS